MRRMGRTAVTWPKVGEFTIESTAANCTVLNTLVASIWIDNVRDWPSVTVFDRPRLTLDVPGPGIVLRPASPNVPGAGMPKAAVLKNRSTVGSATATGAPV